MHVVLLHSNGACRLINVYNPPHTHTVFCSIMRRHFLNLYVEYKQYYIHIAYIEMLWEDNIKTDLQKVAWGGTEWISLAQDREWWHSLVNDVMNLRVS